MPSFRFTVYATPISQPRQRHRVLQLPGRKPVSVNYTPTGDPVNLYKTYLREAALKKMGTMPPLEGAIGLVLRFYLQRPKKYDSPKFNTGAIRHIGNKDLDNLYKAVADAFIGVVYRNDGQIAGCLMEKFYTEKDGRPRVEIEVKYDD